MRAQQSGPSAQAALDQLIRRYDRTVIAIIRSLGHPRDLSAEDLKQEFFLGLLRRGDVDKLDRARGRFRSWLHTAIRNFLKNVWEAWAAEKPGRKLTSPAAFQVQHELTPERALMRQFAEDTVLFALQRQREAASDKASFDRWARFLPGPQLELGDLVSLASAFGMSRNHVAVHVYGMREKHKRVLREVVADTLDVDPSEPEGARAVEQEMQSLYRLLCETPGSQVVLEEA